ncbi:hypothetical protein [Massilia violaceinigra]|nr:hypothetical protein [Massilia violaceinigra]
MMDHMEARIVKLESVTEKILDRLEAVERDVAVIRANYVTKADLAMVESSLKVSIAAVESSLKVSIAAVESSLKVSIAALEATMLKWFVRTGIALAGLSIALSGLAFAAAKYIN